jgi:SAM-dependent methyltransferase
MADKLSEHTSAAEWRGARGDRWRDQLAGMEETLAPLDAPLLQALALDAPVRIADLGCGGGGTSLQLLRTAPAGSVVHGYDISPSLIEHARARVRPEAGEIAFEVVDLAIAPPPGAPYDRLGSRFGLMFFDDPPAAFTNLARWLAPGGRFAFMVWGRPADNLWTSTIREVVAQIIDLPPPVPDMPGPFRYAEVERLLALLAQAELGELAVRDWRGAIAIGGGLPAAEAASFGLAAFSAFGEMLVQAGGDAPARAQRALTERLALYERDGVVRMDARVHVVTGVGPA